VKLGLHRAAACLAWRTKGFQTEPLTTHNWIDCLTESITLEEFTPAKAHLSRTQYAEKREILWQTNLSYRNMQGESAALLKLVKEETDLWIEKTTLFRHKNHVLICNMQTVVLHVLHKEQRNAKYLSCGWDMIQLVDDEETLQTAVVLHSEAENCHKQNLNYYLEIARNI